MLSLVNVFWAELLGTAVLILLGAGVVANVVLAKTKGNNGGVLLIHIGWGLAVFAGVFVASKSGAYLNPAVLIGKIFSGANSYAAGVDITFSTTVIYLLAQFLGAFIGAAVAYFVYKTHFDIEQSAANKFSVFATNPAIRSYGWNVFTEITATFVFVLVVLSFGSTPSGLGPLAVALLVMGIGMSLGGPTGYAINPARDLGPRIAHAILPIKGKGSSDWSYAWVPVVGPLVGGILAGLVYKSNVLYFM